MNREDIEELKMGRNLLTVALDVHMHVTGSYVGRTQECFENDVRVLVWIKNNWRPSTKSPLFDLAVYNLICVAINETDDELKLKISKEKSCCRVPQ